MQLWAIQVFANDPANCDIRTSTAKQQNDITSSHYGTELEELLRIGVGGLALNKRIPSSDGLADLRLTHSRSQVTNRAPSHCY